MTTVSCDDILDTEPIDKIALEQYIQDEAGLTSLLAGVYDALNNPSTGGYYQNLVWQTFDCTTDECYQNFFSGAVTGVTGNVFTTADNKVADLWRVCYLGIDRANQLIANINVPVMDENKRQEILGEALFLRAYFHFILIEYYRNIPLKLTPTTNPQDVKIPQSAPADVYAQIIKDMTEAESKVYDVDAPELGGAASRINKTAIQGILARVCLTMAGYPHNDTSKYAEALKWATKVKNSGKHALNTYADATLNTPAYTFVGATKTVNVNAFTNNGYAQVFINLIQGKYNSKESMWEADAKGLNTQGYIEVTRLGIDNGISVPANFADVLGANSGVSMFAMGSMYDKYQPGDLRRDWALYPFTFSSLPAKTTNVATLVQEPVPATTKFRSIGKYRRYYELGLKNTSNTGINFPILRYSDVLLMLAEAENRVNGPTAIAYDAVNQVRRRGYGLDINTASTASDLPTGLSQGAFQLAIEDERARELCFEGLRRLDLIRWGKWLQRMQDTGTYMGANAPSTALKNMKIEYTNAVEKNMTLPIPLKEMGLNSKLVQNPLWQ
ncbi:RagB/SusD family nutrient uptake outer membrane protein [Flavobacterium daemonense]|nr:RagB/SusD family nutrient uptake outer membrane protein [Flavobacterium daemonense]